MNTEDLNDYIFAKMVTDVAWQFRCKRVDALIDAGEISEDEARSSPQNADDVRQALLTMQHNRQAVFGILAKLEAAQPAASPAPPEPVAGP